LIAHFRRGFVSLANWLEHKAGCGFAANPTCFLCVVTGHLA
jgi:hypothetical protein